MMFQSFEELIKKSQGPALTVGERLVRYAGISLLLSLVVGVYLWVHPME